ncbi:hypothetical protein MFU01_41120 [Myxococcus fulvus]|uniref:Uncharacterized protein n=2 Tax=Myxococcus fulvus TaxID=33 RepID=A0A511T4J2_MYXFU|nr:hypothetical protein MFU01_41120 [Myxococcus fulvus]
MVAMFRSQRSNIIQRGSGLEHPVEEPMSRRPMGALVAAPPATAVLVADSEVVIRPGNLRCTPVGRP